MFSGTIEAMSHEGGLLLSFGGSSPALDSIIVKASDGVYIGKIDGVLGNTEDPIAHVGHIDRKLNLESLIGEEVTIRAKKPREERKVNHREGSNNRNDRRDFRSRDNSRFDRNSNFRNRSDGSDDWDCPKCNNSNFARRTECNRCGEPRPGGGRRDSRGRRDSGRRDFGRGDNRERRDYGGGRGREHRDHGRRDHGNSRQRDGRNSGKTFADNDWDCPKCNNSNFSFRTECNRCGEPRSGGPRRDTRDRRDSGRRDYRGGGGRERRDSGRRDFDRNRRDGDRRFSDRNDRNRRDGDRRFSDRNDRNRRDGDRRFSDRNEARSNDESPKPKQNNFRKARGKRPGHAHNNAPKPITPRKFKRNRDD